jgi:tetratricopeptide (TPR) repeat protein
MKRTLSLLIVPFPGGPSRSRILPLLLTAALAGCGGGFSDAAEDDLPQYRQPLTGAALEHFERGEAADDSSNYELAVQEYASAIKLAPYSVEAHDKYVWAAQNINRSHWGEDEWYEGLRALDVQYAALAEAQPDNPILPYMRGKLWFYDDRDKTREMLLQATTVDPDFAPAWWLLATFAEGRGDVEEVRGYLRRAAEADPTDPQNHAALAFSYGLGTGSSWPDFRSHGEAFVERYPGVDRTAQMLYWLGAQAPTPDLSVRYFRQSIEAHPIEEGEDGRNRWVQGAYRGLYRALQNEAPEEAASVAAAAVEAAFGLDWPQIYQRQVLLNLGQTLRHGGEVDDAMRYLTQASEGESGWMGRGGSRSPESHALDRAIDLERALVHETRGEIDRARDLLLDILTDDADANAKREFERVAAAQGHSEAQVLEAIWSRRLADATPAPGLGIPDLNGDIVELSDFAGNVVLLNFWYPACGPCRVEFPYLSAAVAKFAERGLVALAANIHPEEAAEVGPFMENTGYALRPLQTDADWAEEMYGVRGAPTNFIISPDGQIVYDPGIVNGVEAQAKFERWLDSYFRYLELRDQLPPPAEAVGSSTGAE